VPNQNPDKITSLLERQHRKLLTKSVQLKWSAQHGEEWVRVHDPFSRWRTALEKGFRKARGYLAPGRIASICTQMYDTSRCRASCWASDARRKNATRSERAHRAPENYLAGLRHVDSFYEGLGSL